MMSAPPGSSSSRSRRIPSAAATALAFALLQGLVAPVAFGQDGPGQESPAAPQVQKTRAGGLAFLDLPLRFRAHLDASYNRSLYASDALSRDHVSEFGPQLDTHRSLESHVALTRFVSDRIEIGIVWGGRRRITDTNLLDFERQTVGAMIRFTP
jgi:hypothetical protein